MVISNKLLIFASQNIVELKNNGMNNIESSKGEIVMYQPDETIGIPSDQPQRWMAVGMAMAIQENGTESLDYFAMLRGWGMCRE